MKTIFILGHMRSRSSLLSHIILNNDLFVGMGESNATYTGFLRVNYMKLKSLGYKDFLSFFNKQYVDQINHNIKTPSLELLMDSRIKLIVLVRNPIDSIASIMKLTEKYYEPWSYEKSSNYYSERLNYLSKVCSEKDESDLLYVNSDILIQRTDETLKSLSCFLGLPSNLTSDYSQFEFTGVRGDPSKKISSGKIQTGDKISSDFANSEDSASIDYVNFLKKHSISSLP